MRNSIGVTFVIIILFSSKALSSKPIEEVDTVKVFEYFGSKIIQIRHIMQGRKIYLPCNRTVGAKLGFIEFESQFSEKSKVFYVF